MWPWGHAAVGYLLWSSLVRHVHDRAPTEAEALLLALGTQFPDLVDKPLAWTVGILPAGRSLAHSLLTATFVIALVYGLLSRRGHKLAALAFALGYVSHTLADSLSVIATGEYEALTYFLWPILPAPVYESESLRSNVEQLTLSGLVVLELVLVGFALLRWRLDGMPGLSGLVGRLRAVTR